MHLLLFYQLELQRSSEENDMPLYELVGLETLGSVLRIVAQNNKPVDFSKRSIQWFRIQSNKQSKKEIISGCTISLLQNTCFSTYNILLTIFYTTLILLGATKQVYSPEPHDVGRYLQAEIEYCGQISIARSAGPVDPGLFS
jgi:hypothetical protein